MSSEQANGCCAGAIREEELVAWRVDEGRTFRMGGGVLTAALTNAVVGEGATEGKLKGVRYLKFARKMAPHWEGTQSLALFAVLRGRMRMTVDGISTACGPNEYLVTARETRVQLEVLEGSDDQPFLSMEVQIPAAVVAETIIDRKTRAGVKRSEDLVSSEGATSDSAYVAPIDYDIADVLVRLIRAQGDESDCEVLGPLLLKEVSYRLHKRHSLRFASSMLYEGNSRKVMNAIKYIQTEFHRPISVLEIARAVSASTSALAHSFKAIVGVSPHQFLRQLRLERARVMMIGDGLSVNQAAMRCGYASSSHFVAAFKSYFGECPSLYTKQFRKRAVLHSIEPSIMSDEADTQENRGE